MLLAMICATAIVAPLVEEFAKAYPLFYRYEIPSKPLMTLGFLTGLGFGIAEFIVYVFVNNVPFFIRIHPIFFHAASASIVAYGISQRSTMKFYLLAVILHFMNNFFATLGHLWLIGTIAATIATYYLSYRYFRKSQRLHTTNYPIDS
jgi:RsiW-degrading membrane proteinase PrsW (M82 family)